MYPAKFDTLEDIGKKFKQLSKMLTLDDNRILAQLFHDAYLLAFFSLKRKKTTLGRKSPKNLRLRRAEVARLLRLIYYHHTNNKTPPKNANDLLMQCFNVRNFTEDEALDYFEKFVEGEAIDKQSRKVLIDCEGSRFMYKNDDTGRHEVDSIYFKLDRAKRLPWIKYTIQNTTNIYTKKKKDIRTNKEIHEMMYITEYDIPFKGGGSKRCFWIVITEKFTKDKHLPFSFTTAFYIDRYNQLLKRIEEYEPSDK